MSAKPIHIVHVVYSFATGGLENGVVNLINNLPRDKFTHSIICVSSHDPDFFARITSGNTEIYDLKKPDGKSLKWIFDCWKLLKKIKPDIVHTRNLSALEAQFAAFFSSAKLRVHGEHGWDIRDIGGKNQKHKTIRKIFKPFVNNYIALSKEGVRYLKYDIEVNKRKIIHICNGVNVEKFSLDSKSALLPYSFKGDNSIIFGTVGRLADVKNQIFLLESFIALKEREMKHDVNAKLIIVGDGARMDDLKARAIDSGYEHDIYFAGLRTDIPELMAAMDVFVLPSLAEGISNTILEAMASGLPIIATNVGGNPDLVLPEHQNSHLVEVNNIEEMRISMEQYTIGRECLNEDSLKVRKHCIENFSIQSMVEKYKALYMSVDEIAKRK